MPEQQAETGEAIGRFGHARQNHLDMFPNLVALSDLCRQACLQHTHNPVDVRLLFIGVFVISSLLAALGGVMLGPLIAVQSGMGDPLLILALAVVVIGGVGSLKGALVASLAVGLLDTFGRMIWPHLMGNIIGNIVANASVYILMALVIAVRPSGLFGNHAA